MNIIFKIEEYLPETEQILVRFCEEKSHLCIDRYRSMVIDCKNLDCYSADTFAYSLMRDYGSIKLRIQKDQQPILPENMGSEIDGKLNIQNLVGKVIKMKEEKRSMTLLKTRRVIL
tara:strand:+ start:3459 stop:3806 length:348 start_codon:yes stop_codon:yes gene_type:complete